MIEDSEIIDVKEEIVLEKFEGDVHPDNLVERVYLEDGEIVKHEFIENGAVVRTIKPSEGGEN